VTLNACALPPTSATDTLFLAAQFWAARQLALLSYSRIMAVSIIGTAHMHTVSSLGLASAVSVGGLGELEELSEGGLLVGVVEESLLVDDLGGVVHVASNVLNGGGCVGLGAGLSLGDAVLLLVLQSHGESSLEILVSLSLSHGDSDGVVGLAGVEFAIDAEG